MGPTPTRNRFAELSQQGEGLILLGWLVGWLGMFRIQPHMWHRIQGCPHLGAGRLQPCRSCGWVFLLSQVLKGRFEGSGGGRQIPLQACRIPTIVLPEDKVECRVGVWASPPLEDGPRQSGVRHVLSLRESDSNNDWFLKNPYFHILDVILEVFYSVI